ncbi:MAG: hypothetical protein IIV93_02595 [Clostridia bacterium]|nr:hypothetical protein [Clostridia bacterium]
MKNRNHLSIALVSLTLIIGLLLPFLTSAAQDAALNLRHWPFSEENAHYAYQGTLMNRVLALNAHLNSSPAVVRCETGSLPAPSGLLASLSSLLPVSEEAGAVHTASFCLSPKQYSAEYQYQTVDYELSSASLSAIIDSETQLPLRIELTMSPDSLNEWLAGRSLWDILHSYAALLDLGEPTDDETNISTVLRSQSAQLRGTAYKTTVTVIPSTGSLLLKLSASTPA